MERRPCFFFKCELLNYHYTFCDWYFIYTYTYKKNILSLCLLYIQKNTYWKDMLTLPCLISYSRGGAMVPLSSTVETSIAYRHQALSVWLIICSWINLGKWPGKLRCHITMDSAGCWSGENNKICVTTSRNLRLSGNWGIFYLPIVKTYLSQIYQHVAKKKYAFKSSDPLKWSHWLALRASAEVLRSLAKIQLSSCYRPSCYTHRPDAEPVDNSKPEKNHITLNMDPLWIQTTHFWCWPRPNSR